MIIFLRNINFFKNKPFFFIKKKDIFKYNLASAVL